ncbi:hypothetical protein [Spiroplasma endosymbiont of Panzeria rudis]|uniref:hypothetical protein n=1 Tax=Spiroplasma endosymbiont of Panzeria rudis TaxID=3066301 RepID=UPI0030D4D4EC
MWRSYNEWSQADKDKYNKEAKETNKVWGEKNEKERREKVANALDLEKNKAKINQSTTNENQSSSSKSAQM